MAPEEVENFMHVQAKALEVGEKVMHVQGNGSGRRGKSLACLFKQCLWMNGHWLWSKGERSCIFQPTALDQGGKVMHVRAMALNGEYTG